MESLNVYFLTIQVPDVTNTDPVAVAVPDGGKIIEMRSVLHKAMGAGGNVTLTGKIGSTAITNGVITITQAGSAANDIDTVYPTAARTVVNGSALSVTSNGGGAAARATVTFKIKR
jgi:hypothetical protein